MRKYEWLSLSKVKKIAEDFLAKYPTLFSADFEANKKSLDQLAIIPNRALRNQIAGAITKRMSSEASENSDSDSLDKLDLGQEMDLSEAPAAETVSQQAQ